MSLLIFTRSNLFFALCPVLALVSLAACNDPPKKRPSAGNVLPSPKQADSTEAERAEQLKAQKEEADRQGCRWRRFLEVLAINADTWFRKSGVTSQPW